MKSNESVVIPTISLKYGSLVLKLICGDCNVFKIDVYSNNFKIIFILISSIMKFYHLLKFKLDDRSREKCLFLGILMYKYT